MKTKSAYLVFALFLVLGCRPDNRKEQLEQAVDRYVQEQSEKIQEEAEAMAEAIVEGNNLGQQEPNKDERCADLCAYMKRTRPPEDSIQMLLESQLDPNCLCTIHYSTKRFGARIPIVKDFMKRKYNSHSSDKTPLNMALESENEALITLFLTHGAPADAQVGNTTLPINIALATDKMGIINLLIEKGANPSHADLSYAKSEKVIDEFIDAGADPSKIDIQLALSKKDPQFLRRLMKKGAQPSKVSHFSLIRFHKTIMLKILLEEGMDPNVEGERGKGSLLIEAISAGKKDKAQLILDAGADPNLLDNFDKSPLHAAIKSNWPEIIPQLVEKGAEVNPAEGPFFYKNPLELAVQRGNPEVIQALLDVGAKVSSEHNSNREYAISIEADSSIIALLD